MTDMLIDIHSIDVNQIEKAKKEAEKLMEKYKNSKDKVDMERFIEAEDMLYKSIAQLKLSQLK
jgi:F0F1-type ATP synthase epsilon subunit